MKRIRSVMAATLSVGLILAAAPSAQADQSRQWYSETCGSSSIRVTAGTVGYLSAEAVEFYSGTLKTKNYGWVDYPNPQRTWNTGYTTTSYIWIGTSGNVWTTLPYLHCW